MGESSRNRVIILLLFLAAYRIGEVAGDLRGLKATNVLLGPECLILTKEDSKTKSQSTTSFVVNSTNSGLQPLDTGPIGLAVLGSTSRGL